MHVSAFVTEQLCSRCRHVMLPKEIVKLVPKNHLMSEEEWRGIGVQQSQGWQHYMHHGPGLYTCTFSQVIAPVDLVLVDETASGSFL